VRAERQLAAGRLIEIRPWRTTPLELTLAPSPDRTSLGNGRTVSLNALSQGAVRDQQLSELTDRLLSTPAARFRLLAPSPPVWLRDELVSRGVEPDRLEAVSAPGSLRLEVVE
jgi:hypothetical protein